MGEIKTYFSVHFPLFFCMALRNMSVIRRGGDSYDCSLAALIKQIVTDPSASLIALSLTMSQGIMMEAAGHDLY